MDAVTLQVLEFHKIIELVARRASTPPGRAHVASLQPLDSFDGVVGRLARVAEMTALVEEGKEPDLSGLDDIAPLLEAAGRPGAVLTESQVVATGFFLDAVRRLAAHFRGKSKRYPLLCELADGLRPQDDLRRRIWTAVDPESGVKDSLPVPINDKGRVKGLVLDRSDSGRTFFIEPLSVLDLNNRLRELEMDELREVRRILRELTDGIREVRDDLLSSRDALALIDSFLARARFGLDVDGAVPAVKGDGPLKLRRARHPLLVARERGRPGKREPVVPLDLDLEDGVRVLLISGPNAGGKTVALKTVGLLCLMTQAGLPIPASPDSEMRIYDRVLADIGDRQSIEEDISTFSAHVRRLREILRAAGPGSLVIVDEIGVGTDPAEGAALAWALLESLADSGCLTVASTHYGGLKALVSTRDDMINGSLEFDGERLAPTYRFQPGVPGSSFGLEIARRLGLPRRLVNRAEKRLPEPDRRLGKLLRELETERARYHRERETLESEKVGLAELVRRYEEKIGGVKREAGDILNQARREAAAMLESGRALVENAVREIREKSADRQAIKQARADLAAEMKRLKETEPEEPPPAGQTGWALAPGTRVRLDNIEPEALVLEGPDSGGMLLLRVGRLKLRVHKNRVLSASADGGAERRTVPADRIGVQLVETGGPADEIDLRGQTQEEAEAMIAKYLDLAHLSGISRVRIIHGKGTGALRRRVQETLNRHPRIKSYQLGSYHEGGSGVTVAELTD